jgi:hypothetical protein
MGTAENKRVLSIDEMRRLYDSQWLLVEDPVTTPMLQVTAGKVLWHSKNKQEIYQKLEEFKPTNAALIFAGDLVLDGVFLLNTVPFPTQPGPHSDSSSRIQPVSAPDYPHGSGYRCDSVST